jgi:hypothetical protein
MNPYAGYENHFEERDEVPQAQPERAYDSEYPTDVGLDTGGGGVGGDYEDLKVEESIPIPLSSQNAILPERPQRGTIVEEVTYDPNDGSYEYGTDTGNGMGELPDGGDMNETAEDGPLGQTYIEWCEGEVRKRFTASECKEITFVPPFPTCYCIEGM